MTLPAAVEFPIDQIVIGERHRKELQGIPDLAASIDEFGLIHSITVRRVDGRIELVEGHRRLLAHKHLGRATIPTVFRELTDDDAELIEIEENLQRQELTDIERADHMLRKKEIHERKHPETKHGGAPGKTGEGKGKAPGIKVLGSEDFNPVPSFVEKHVADTAAAGKPMARQTVERYLAVAQRLSQSAREIIKGTEVEKKITVLEEIMRMPTAEKQNEAAVAAVKGATSADIYEMRTGKPSAKRAGSRKDTKASGSDSSSAPSINEEEARRARARESAARTNAQVEDARRRQAEEACGEAEVDSEQFLRDAREAEGAQLAARHSIEHLCIIIRSALLARSVDERRFVLGWLNKEID
jgi:hypothetical protein